MTQVILDFRLALDVNTVLMSFFLNSFQSLVPRIGTHGNFIMFLVFIVLFWLLLFGLLMFHKYSVATLVFLFSFSKSIVYCIDGSWLLSMSKNCNDCCLLLEGLNYLKDCVFCWGNKYVIELFELLQLLRFVTLWKKCPRQFLGELSVLHIARKLREETILLRWADHGLLNARPYLLQFRGQF